MLARIWNSSTRKIKMVYSRVIFEQCNLCTLPCSSWLCEDCFNQLPKLHRPCQQCGQPGYAPHTCGHCLVAPPPYDRLWVAYEYRTPVDNMIRAWKDRHQPLPPFHFELTSIISAYEYDVIAPIPSHWLRQLKKGHHPTQQLAKAIAHSHPLKPSVKNLLKRHKYTKSQRGLDKQQRQQNLKKAFRVTRPLSVKGKRILLVDDVITTGATASSAAHTLLSHGALSVSIACLARTPELGAQ